MGQPQVSVVIPVWNGERYLRQAIESILAQDFADFELIVVDDGSTDGSAVLAESFMSDNRVSVRRQINAGVVAARNAGLQAARAEYVAFLDADDIAKPERLTKQVAYLRSHPEVAVVGSHITHFDDHHGVLRTQCFPDSPVEVARALETGNPLAQPAVMLRRSAALAVGGYREAFKHGAEDYDLWLRIVEKHPLANLPEALTLYRVHPGSLTHRRRPEQTLAALIAACAHRRRVAGMPDPLADIASPLGVEHLPGLKLSDAEEAALMPARFALLERVAADASSTVALLERAWELRRHLPRGRLVRHCLTPGARRIRAGGAKKESWRWLLRAFLTEPLSACWMLSR